MLRTLPSIVVLVLVCAHSAYADPITINVAPTGGFVTFHRNPGTNDDQFDFNLSANHFLVGFGDNESFYNTGTWGFLSPNRGFGFVNLFQPGQFFQRVGFLAILDHATNVLSGNIRVFENAGGPIDPFNEVPIYIFTFSAIGVIAQNDGIDFVYNITGPAPAPEPSSLVLAAIGIIGILKATKKRRASKS